MKITPVRKNTLRILKQCIDRAYSRHFARCRKMSIHNPSLWKRADFAKELDELFPYFASLGPTRHLGHIPSNQVSVMIHAVLRCCYNESKMLALLEQDIINDLRNHAAEYELLAIMPQPKRVRKKSRPRTLVEKRADAVDEKVLAWQRKLKLAKTKLAAYMKKQSYYRSKLGSKEVANG